jgi:hypothetical protein
MRTAVRGFNGHDAGRSRHRVLLGLILLRVHLTDQAAASLEIPEIDEHRGAAGHQPCTSRSRTQSLCAWL